MDRPYSFSAIYPSWDLCATPVIPTKAGIQRGWATEMCARSAVKTTFIAVMHRFQLRYDPFDAATRLASRYQGWLEFVAMLTDDDIASLVNCPKVIVKKSPVAG